MCELARRVRLAALGAALVIASTSGAEAQSWRTTTSARQLWGTEPVKVSLEYGAGHLEVAPAEKSMLYRMETRYDEEQFAPVSSFAEGTRTLKLGVRARDGRRGMKVRNGSYTTIALTREVPLDLGLDFGAGEAEIQLGGMRIRRLDVSTGASETKIRFDEPNPGRAEWVQINAGAADLTVSGLGNARADRVTFQGGVGSTVLDFRGQWAGDAVAEVKMGIGSVVLRLPRALGVRIERSSFLTSFDPGGMVKRDGSYFSSNWGKASHHLTIEVAAALGSIEVDWVD